MKDYFGFDWSRIQGTQYWSKPQLGRRMFFRHAASSVAGYLLMRGGALEKVARAAVTTRGTARNVIFIMMQGAPSHTDTFDLKAGNPFPKSFNPTDYNGVLFPQGLMPKLAAKLDSIALVRSMRAWANVHGLMQQWVQIGRNPAAPTSKISPHIGSVVALELTKKDAILPAFLALNGTPPAASGFLPVADAPFIVTAGGGLPNTTHPDGADRFASRNALLQAMEATADATEMGAGPDEIAEWKARAQMLMYNSDVDRIFNITSTDRARYGNTGFGNACATAHNLLKADMGTRFIQITLGSWDYHSNLYTQLVPMAAQFDNGLGALIADLQNDSLFDQTLIVAQGEFGRTVGGLNGNSGRDHYQQQAMMFAGAGIHGGRAIGATDDIGARTIDPGWSRQRDIRPEDVEATIYSALGIDWTTLLADKRFGRGYYYVPSSDQDLYGPIDELWG
jgi:uncharacterized protein DUF1501